MLLLIAPLAFAQRPNYDDDIKPIFRRYCFTCHSASEARNGLNLEAYAGVVKGGNSGDVVKPGRPGASILYLAVAHEGDGIPRMPFGLPKIPDNAIATIRDWIQQGVLENAASRPKGPAIVANVYTGAALNKPAGPAAMPQALPALSLPAPARPQPVTAMAASPWAPLLAVAGHDRIYLYSTDTRALLGELPFPEGIPYVLRFSRDGSKLLAGGGRGVEIGKVAIYDVRTGRRLATIGQEMDIVLAADLSADGKLVALGGPGKLVKVFHAADGTPAYQIKKHTDWITAIEFSPDGTKLATADRSGGIYLWEAATGNILVPLAEHKDSVTSLSWRGDGALLASASEDGELVIWNVADGFPVATKPNAHAPKPAPGFYGKPPNGILSVQFLPDGRLATVGRDNTIKLWTSDGKPQGASKHFETLLTKVAASYDSKLVIAGDYQGSLVVWDGKETTLLSRR